MFSLSGRKVAFAQFACPLSADAIPPLQCLESVFAHLLRAAFLLTGILAFLFLIVGGFKYLTAGGDEKAIGDAQKTITGAVLGLVFVVAAYALLAILSYYLFDSTSTLFQFTIPGPTPTPGP